MLLRLPRDEWAKYAGGGIRYDADGYLVTGDPLIDEWEREIGRKAET